MYTYFKKSQSKKAMVYILRLKSPVQNLSILRVDSSWKRKLESR